MNDSQFEIAHRVPLGRHWNTESTFAQLITPKINTVIGKAIPPMTITEDVAHFIKSAATRKLKNVAQAELKRNQASE